MIEKGETGMVVMTLIARGDLCRVGAKQLVCVQFCDCPVTL